MRQLYLDANAHLPMSKKAIEAFVEYNRSLSGHGHPMSPSTTGRAAMSAIEKARAQIAVSLGADASQIFFTSSCTQACEWGVFILSQLVSNGIIYISKAEHPAIKQAFEYYCRLSINGIRLGIDANGVVQAPEDLDAGVICIHIQNEIGVIQPIEKFKCKYLLSDMCQSAGKCAIDMSKMNVDIATFGAHKFGGPVGVGFLYLRDPKWWNAFGTGSRYFMDRPGTPDVASIVATAAALKESMETLPERAQNMVDFRNVLEDGLDLLDIEIIGKNAVRCPNTTFLHLAGGLGVSVMLQLCDKGIYTGLGSACGSAYTGPSPLMKALGRDEGPHDFIRVSNYGEYSGKDAEYFLEQFSKLV